LNQQFYHRHIHAGLSYQANDPELIRDRHNVKVKLLELNTKLIGGTKECHDLARTILDDPTSTCYIEPPFHCDYGYNIHVDEGFYCNFGCVILGT
jgi:maltose O-acetyltransferase